MDRWFARPVARGVRCFGGLIVLFLVFKGVIVPVGLWAYDIYIYIYIYVINTYIYMS